MLDPLTIHWASLHNDTLLCLSKPCTCTSLNAGITEQRWQHHLNNCLPPPLRRRANSPTASIAVMLQHVLCNLISREAGPVVRSPPAAPPLEDPSGWSLKVRCQHGGELHKGQLSEKWDTAVRSFVGVQCGFHASCVVHTSLADGHTINTVKFHHQVWGSLQHQEKILTEL